MDKKVDPYKGIAIIYDEIRPSYPEKLICDIVSKTGIKSGDKLLDIGAGTGKATIQFADKGFEVHAIEPSEDMAKILIDRCACYPKVTLDVASFEEWSCPNNKQYDMIYCAQAFHWLDNNIKYKKCHELLKDNGCLVLFWYAPNSDKLPETKEIDDKVMEVVNKYFSDYYVDNGEPKRREHNGVIKDDDRNEEIAASGLFKVIQRIEYTHEIRENANQYLMALKSVPAFASRLDSIDDGIIVNMDNDIKKIVKRHGGSVSVLFDFSLYITQKK